MVEGKRDWRGDVVEGETNSLLSASTSGGREFITARSLSQAGFFIWTLGLQGFVGLVKTSI